MFARNEGYACLTGVRGSLVEQRSLAIWWAVAPLRQLWWGKLKQDQPLKHATSNIHIDTGVHNAPLSPRPTTSS